MALNLLQRRLFEKSLYHPWAFHLIRQALYWKNGNDTENVHDDALNILNDEDVLKILERNRHLFEAPPYLKVRMGKFAVSPYGQAAGMDKNAVALRPLSKIFGWNVFGSIPRHPREGNPKPRMDADFRRRNTYNSIGYKNDGADAVAEQAKVYKEENHHKEGVPFIESIAPIPEVGNPQKALGDVEYIVGISAPHVDGYEENLSSPNTETVPMLRTSKYVKESLRIMNDIAPGHLKLFKLWPYKKGDSESRELILSLARTAYENGANGVVLVNTLPTEHNYNPKDPNSKPKRAGKGGRDLIPYMLRAVSDVRQEILDEDFLIIACGGIGDGPTALSALHAGADMFAGFSSITFDGFSVVPNIYKFLGKELARNGYSSLQEMKYDTRQKIKRFASYPRGVV